MKRLAYALVGLILVWGLTPFWIPALANWLGRSEPVQSTEQSASKDAPKRIDLAPAGQLGDMFGSVNSLFSGIALIGVAYGLYLQTQHKRREKQPEVFARLSSNSSERPVVLARNADTPAGKVQFALQAPVYIEGGGSAIAFNVAIRVDFFSASKNTTLSMPVFTGSKLEDPQLLNLTIGASALTPAIARWNGTQSFPLGDIEIHVEFENQQQAKWRVTAKYSVSVRSAADADALKDWINKAAASSIAIQQIELDTTATSWRSMEL